MRTFIIVLIAGIAIVEQVILSILYFFYIRHGSYGDEDLFLATAFGISFSLFLGIVVGIGLFFLMTRSRVNKRQVIRWLILVLLLGCVCRFYLGEKLVPSLVNAAMTNNLNYLNISIMLQKNLNIKDINGQTSLIKASEHRNLYFATRLIEAGADLNAQDNRGWTALMVAVYGKGFPQTDDCELSEQLIKAGINVNIKNNHGENALELASQVGNTCSINLLNREEIK